MSLSRLHRMLAVGTTAVVVAAGAHAAIAAPDGSNVVISEVYGGGGNSGAPYSHDFIELYNPTNAPISLNGWTVTYYSAKGNPGGSTTLSGEIAAGGYYLIQQAKGSGAAAALPTPDAVGTLSMSGAQGSVELVSPSGSVDLVGYGGASKAEGTATATLSSSTSASRDSLGTDTDNNAADFTIGTPNPQNSSAGAPTPPEGGSEPGTDPTTGQPAPTDPTTEPAPTDPAPTEPAPEPPAAAELSIAEIQGTGNATPYNGQQVSTTGVVTARYLPSADDKSLKGFVIQTDGTGGQAGEASHGIFVYMATAPDSAYPEPGSLVRVTGEAGEFYGQTQLTEPTVETLGQPVQGITPVILNPLPAEEAARERLESMLVLPTNYAVTNNYTGLGRTPSGLARGEIGLAPHGKPFRQPSDIFAPDTDPNSPIQRLIREQAADRMILDDGSTTTFTTKEGQAKPLPWLTVAGQPGQSLRAGDVLTFEPVILGYGFNAWRFQPTEVITGNSATLPISWQDSRPAALTAVDSIGTGDNELTIASFNVLNYFTTLGESIPGCRSYNDRFGNPLTAANCSVRGAYSQAAFADQQSKIVAAINRLDASVVGLEEIENTSAVKISGDISRRDEALAQLVEALNAAGGPRGGGTWAYVPSPDVVGEDEDAIRLAFIYNRDDVAPVGQSRILNDPAFTAKARQPLAQAFKRADDQAADAATFVTIVNHYKSKGSLIDGHPDPDIKDGQGNNARIRNAQATALVNFISEQEDWKDSPLFVLGDLNAYSKEDVVGIFETNGFSNVAHKFVPEATSYQFDGLHGSLDHVLSNPTATKLVTDAAVWPINSPEPIVYEYSRRNHSAVDLVDPTTPFRSSDHDPIKVAFTFGSDQAPTETTSSAAPSESEAPSSSAQPSTPAEPTETTSSAAPSEPEAPSSSAAPSTTAAPSEPSESAAPTATPAPSSSSNSAPTTPAAPQANPVGGLIALILGGFGLFQLFGALFGAGDGGFLGQLFSPLRLFFASVSTWFSNLFR